jgi:hypothetical protein
VKPLALLIVTVIAGASLGAGVVWLHGVRAPNPRVAALIRGYNAGDDQITFVVRDDPRRRGPD